MRYSFHRCVDMVIDAWYKFHLFELLNVKLLRRTHMFLYQVLDCQLRGLPGRLKHFSLHTLSMKENKSNLSEKYYSYNIIIDVPMILILLTFRVGFKEDTNEWLVLFHSFWIMNHLFSFGGRSSTIKMSIFVHIFLLVFFW